MPIQSNPVLETELVTDTTRLLQLAVLTRLQLWETTNALERLLDSHLTRDRVRGLKHLDDIIAEFCSEPTETPGAVALRATAEALIAILDDWPPEEDPAALEPAILDVNSPRGTYGIQFHPDAFTMIYPALGEDPTEEPDA